MADAAQRADELNHFTAFHAAHRRHLLDGRENTPLRDARTEG